MHELLYPATHAPTLLALITFLLLTMLAEAAGLFGLWLAIVILPAYFRYLLYLLEARANGRDTPVPGIELFNWVENFWSLFPLVLAALWIWIEYFLMQHVSHWVAMLAAAALLVLYPASMAVLALTRSPLESLKPTAMLDVVKACGSDYWLVPTASIAFAAAITALARLGAPGVLIRALALYASFLLFTLMGRVLQERGGSIEADLDEPAQGDAAKAGASLARRRTEVLNHAYGFVSRGNRQGGIRHIQQWIEGEADTDAAYRWFIDAMLKWESTEAGLVLAQHFLSRLLADGQDVPALKLIGRCLLENKAFKPLPEDRHAAVAAAERQGNRDLARRLKDLKN